MDSIIIINHNEMDYIVSDNNRSYISGVEYYVHQLDIHVKLSSDGLYYYLLLCYCIGIIIISVPSVSVPFSHY